MEKEISSLLIFYIENRGGRPASLNKEIGMLFEKPKQNINIRKKLIGVKKKIIGKKMSNIK